MSKLLDGLLESQTVESLAKLKIFSVDQFLRADVEKLTVAGLTPKAENWGAQVLKVAGSKSVVKIGEFRPPQVPHCIFTISGTNPLNFDSMKLKLEFSKLFLPSIVAGDEHYRIQLKKCSIMQTWIPGLDDLLEGGLRMGTLLEVCGASGSGKTQLCLNIAVRLAAEYKIEVLYVDTKGDFAASQLASLIEDLGFQKDFDAILERVKVAKPRTIHALISTLHHLQEAYRTQKKIKIIILDSLASLYFPFIGSKTDGNEGLSLLNHVASLLKKLAVSHHLAVLLVNLGTRWSPEEEFEGDCGDEKLKQTSNTGEQEEPLKPVMGKYWAHVPNTRLFLVRDQPDSSARTLIVHKSEYLASGKTSRCVINPNGTIA